MRCRDVFQCRNSGNTDKPFTVRRYFCRGWRGLSGYSKRTNPSLIAGSRQLLRKFSLSAKESNCIISSKPRSSKPSPPNLQKNNPNQNQSPDSSRRRRIFLTDLHKKIVQTKLYKPPKPALTIQQYIRSCRSSLSEKEYVYLRIFSFHLAAALVSTWRQYSFCSSFAVKR